MQDSTKAPLLVEFYLQGAHVSGVSRQVEQRRRLVDVLNGQEGTFELDSAKLTIQSSGMPRFFPTLSLQKRSIIAAIPHETQDQVRMRAVLNSGMGRAGTMQAQIAVLVPPYYIEGTAHMAPGSGKLRPDPAVFTHFFPITAAQLFLPEGQSLELPVLLVNRDCISAMALLSEAQLIRP